MTDMLTGRAIIKAIDFLGEDHSFVATGGRIGEVAIGELSSGKKVVISLKDFRGVPSSFFNILLKVIVDRFGPDVIGESVTFDFDSAAQKEVFRRSRDLLKKSA